MTPQEQKVMELALEALEKLTNAADGFSVSGVYFNEELWARKCLDDAYDAMGFAQESLAQEKALQALHDENERLGLYKDAYAQPEQEPVGYFNANSDGKWEQSDSNDGVPFYAALPPQPKEPEQEPLEYWNAVEGWVKIDEVREHFDSVGCATIYKTAGEGRVPLSLCKAQPAVAEQHKQEPVAWMSEHRFDELRQGFTVMTTLTKQRAFEDDIALYTTPPQPEQEPTNDWSEWRGMVVQNLMRHGIDKDFARRLAHFYQDKAPQFKEPEQRSVSEHLEPVALNKSGIQKLLKQSGFDNATPEETAAFISGIRHREAEMLDTTPPPVTESHKRKPLSGYINGAGINANDSPHIVVEKLERAIKSAHGITKE